MNEWFRLEDSGATSGGLERVVVRGTGRLAAVTATLVTMAAAIVLLVFSPVATAAGQGAAGGIPGFPGGWPTSLSPVFPAVSGPITVTLSPVSRSTPDATASPADAPPITCDINLSQYVHYSNPGNDTSWHWTWSCDEPVSLTGGHALYVEGYPYVTGPVSDSGFSGNENIRYGGCIGAYWWGTAYGTFSSPGHLSASFEGSSPTNLINCP